MPLPKFLEPFLPSYDISKMDLHNLHDKKLIIEAVLNQGTMKEIKWLFKTYSLREIKMLSEIPLGVVGMRELLIFGQRFFKLNYTH